MKEEVEQIIAEGNLVVSRWRSSATFTGDIEGVSIKDKKIAIQEMAIYHIANEKMEMLKQFIGLRIVL